MNAFITTCMAVAMNDLPVLLGPTNIVSGFKSTVPSAMGPRFLTGTVRMIRLTGVGYHTPLT